MLKYVRMRGRLNVGRAGLRIEPFIAARSCMSFVLACKLICTCNCKYNCKCNCKCNCNCNWALCNLRFRLATCSNPFLCREKDKTMYGQWIDITKAHPATMVTKPGSPRNWHVIGSLSQWIIDHHHRHRSIWIRLAIVSGKRQRFILFGQLIHSR